MGRQFPRAGGLEISRRQMTIIMVVMRRAIIGGHVKFNGLTTLGRI
jgi:hypothetical protein